MKIFAIVVLTLVLLYLALTYAIARFSAILLFTPPVRFRPTKEQIVNNAVKEFASQHTMYGGADFNAYEKWEREEFELDNKGVKIPAEYHPVPNARGCAILAHGFGQNRYQEVGYAEIFRKMGFSTVIYDQRCFGASQAPNGGFSELEGTDLVALVEWVKQKCGPDTKIVVQGVSLGGMTVMNALGLTDKIDYAINDCGPARALDGALFVIHSMIPLPNPFMRGEILRKSRSLGLHIENINPIDGVAKTNVPVCIIHGDADKAVPVSDAKEIYAVCKNKNSRLEIFPGREHGYSICDTERYVSIIEDFLKEI